MNLEENGERGKFLSCKKNKARVKGNALCHFGES